MGVLNMKTLEAYRNSLVDQEIATPKKAFWSILGILLLCTFLAIDLILVSNLLDLPMILYLAIIAVCVVMFSTFVDISSESKTAFKIFSIVKWLWVPELIVMIFLRAMYG